MDIITKMKSLSILSDYQLTVKPYAVISLNGLKMVLIAKEISYFRKSHLVHLESILLDLELIIL
ncbi:hypothetical protein FS935_12395 [Metabacillus litoralis]|uniref:Uncharacterized protein n=1 Tax=Metabacillus litoralis TaxID=152268 RepID=A0A5C6W4A5_9BACI|nr:hypothetical protein [Metabacillus litoralis]TXC90703.1 hypothetical protein FS935_12395 [Metabacillus litoralis]